MTKQRIAEIRALVALNLDRAASDKTLTCVRPLCRLAVTMQVKELLDEITRLESENSGLREDALRHAASARSGG